MPQSRSLLLAPPRRLGSLPPPAGDAAVTGLGKLTKDWGIVLRNCRALLLRLAENSPRYIEYYSSGPPSEKYLLVQDDVYRDKCADSATVRTYLRSFAELEKWAASVGLNVWDMRQLDVAVFLRDQSERGKTVPNRLYRALVWAEKAFGLTLHTSTAVVKSQANRSTDGPKPPPVSAEMATVKMVADMEFLVTDAPTLPLRVYAGACACLAHGVLRWGDLLWSEKIHLTADALVGL